MCASPVPAGNVCDDAGDCQSGLMCNAGFSPARCEPLSEVGQPCGSVQDCKTLNCDLIRAPARRPRRRPPSSRSAPKARVCDYRFFSVAYRFSSASMIPATIGFGSRFAVERQRIVRAAPAQLAPVRAVRATNRDRSRPRRLCPSSRSDPPVRRGRLPHGLQRRGGDQVRRRPRRRRPRPVSWMMQPATAIVVAGDRAVPRTGLSACIAGRLAWIARRSAVDRRTPSARPRRHPDPRRRAQRDQRLDRDRAPGLEIEAQAARHRREHDGRLHRSRSRRRCRGAGRRRTGSTRSAGARRSRSGANRSGSNPSGSSHSAGIVLRDVRADQHARAGRDREAADLVGARRPTG